MKYAQCCERPLSEWFTGLYERRFPLRRGMRCYRCGRVHQWRTHEEYRAALREGVEGG